MRDESIEAYKASDVLGMLLKKLRHPKDNMQGNCPAPASLPEVATTLNLTQMYPGTAINNGIMTLPPPQQYVPRDQLIPTVHDSIGATIHTEFPPPIASTAATATAPSVPMLPGFSVSNVHHPNYQDPVRYLYIWRK
jgi:hypothetical protein